MGDSADEHAAVVWYRVLGSLQVGDDGRRPALGPPKQRALLAILVLNANELVPVDRLVDLLWPDQPPRTAAHSIQIYVSELRKAFESDGTGPAIVTRPPGYVLLADPDTIDARRFERLISQGERDLEARDPSAALIAFQEALGLWRGPPLSDFSYEEFAQEEIRRLEGLRVDALEQSAAAEIELGRNQAALAAIEAAIASDPLRERARELEMVALYRTGRQPEALLSYEQFRALLSEELGIDPSPSLQRLRRRLIDHDPSLVGSHRIRPSVAPVPATGASRSATWFGVVFGLIGLIVVGALVGEVASRGGGPPDVVLLFEGTGDAGFGDMAADGLDRAVSEFRLKAETRLVSPGHREVETELRELSAGGAHLVLVGLGAVAEGATAAVAADHPETRFVVWEAQDDLPANVTNVTFRSEEGAYLAGAAAARTSRTRVIGFIGAWDHPVIDAYLAGYEAGARSVDPGIRVLRAYLAEPPDLSAFSSPRLGGEAATRLYSGGADVIMAVAGTSSRGVFDAATRPQEAPDGRQLWAIGIDTDEYRSVLARPELVSASQDPASWQPHILTSVMKRLDEAIYQVLVDYAAGSLDSGPRSFGLAEGGVAISYSGGFIDDLRPDLDGLRDRIVVGEIAVPTEPAD